MARTAFGANPSMWIGGCFCMASGASLGGEALHGFLAVLFLERWTQFRAESTAVGMAINRLVPSTNREHEEPIAVGPTQRQREYSHHEPDTCSSDVGT
jgi:hypothetical protein